MSADSQPPAEDAAPAPDDRAQRLELARARLAERGMLRTGPRADGASGILARPDVPGVPVTAEGRRADGSLGILARPAVPGAPVPTAPPRHRRDEDPFADVIRLASSSSAARPKAPQPPRSRASRAGARLGLATVAATVLTAVAAVVMLAAGGGHAADDRMRSACARFDRLEQAVSSATATPNLVRDEIDGMSADLHPAPSTPLARATRSLAAAGGPSDSRFPPAAAAVRAACSPFGR